MRVKSILIYYCFLTALILLDIILLMVSTEYRNMLGVLDNKGYFLRILPTIILLMLLLRNLYFVWNSKFEGAKLQLIFFSIISIIACVPWIGIFVILFTPISTLYLSAILLSSDGYGLACVICLIFLVTNIFFLRKLN